MAGSSDSESRLATDDRRRSQGPRSHGRDRNRDQDRDQDHGRHRDRKEDKESRREHSRRSDGHRHRRRDSRSSERARGGEIRERERGSRRPHRDAHEDRIEGSPIDGGADSDVGPAPPPSIDPKVAKLGAAPLTKDDYYLKAAEFKLWLAESKHKYLDEISSKDARRYFDKFVDRWNAGKLSDDFYVGQVRSAAAPSSLQTRHKWGFASKSSYTQAEQDALASVRDTVDTMTNAQTRGAIEARAAERRASKGRKMHGAEGEEPRDVGSGANAGVTDSGWNAKRSSSSTLAGTSYADRQFEREAAQEARQREEAAKRRRANRDANELAEELAPRATGRDAIIEKRREQNAANRAFANRKDDDGFEMDDATLMGGGGDEDFRRALQAQERGGSRREQIKQDRRAERQAEMNERVSAMRTKEQDTMAMFKLLAQQRFGGGSS